MPSFKIKSLHSDSLDKESRHEKNVFAQSKPIKNIPSDEQRAPFLFQIGFDFGTSASKVVIRDINIEKSWVFQHSDAENLAAILIPSVVLFDDDTFTIHDNIDMLYPKNGLYHLKVALERIALSKDEQIFPEYRNIIGENCKYSDTKIIKMATIFFLSVWLKRIVAHIKNKYPSYGSLKEDQILVNMAIPVEDIRDENVRRLFRSMLSIAWELKTEPIIDTSMKIDDLYECISIINNNCIENNSCQVYPEVSANVQAFIKSPASSPDQTTIYFFTDVGAGTVDQSVFTFAGGEERKLHYFAGKVFPHGSRSIELLAYRENPTIQNLEYWRRVKEEGNENRSVIKAAKTKVRDDVERDTEKTLEDTQKCLFEGNGISKQKTLQEKVKFIFSGGGFVDFPYKKAIIDSFKKSTKIIHDPIVISMPYPDDLELPEKCRKYITRFYVAYGLSFLFDDLVKCSLPSENETENENKTLSDNPKAQRCSCEGNNKDCTRCFGTGIIS